MHPLKKVVPLLLHGEVLSHVQQTETLCVLCQDVCRTLLQMPDSTESGAVKVFVRCEM